MPTPFWRPEINSEKKKPTEDEHMSEKKVNGAKGAKAAAPSQEQIEAGRQGDHEGRRVGVPGAEKSASSSNGARRRVSSPPASSWNGLENMNL